MEIIHISASHIPPIHDTSVACIGYFDGLHIGHQLLIDKTISLCDQQDIPAVICFDEDPWVIMHKSHDIHYITPFEERMYQFEQRGIHRCFLLHFDEAMRQLDKQAFIQNILQKLHLKALVCGRDFRFSYQGEGSIDDLANQPFALHALEPICYNQHKVSSSAIEVLIKEGAIEETTALLGRHYTIKGKVCHGRGVGAAKLGFPTANLRLSENYIIPKNGVYMGKVDVLDKQYTALINIGHNPTMNYQENTSIEAYLLAFDKAIYNEEMRITFIAYIRPEKKFATIEALIQQLHSDVQHITTLAKDVKQ